MKNNHSLKLYIIAGEASGDLHALEQGYASMVPTQFDMTAYSAMAAFKTWDV